MKTLRSFYGSVSSLFMIVLFLMASHDIEAQGWYDTDWPYRRAVAIPNPSGSELVDFQVEITLTEGTNFDFSDALGDGSDIRCTSDDGTTLISFWIENW